MTEDRSNNRDELDLIDLGVGLARRWRLIITVVLVFTLLGLLVAMIKAPHYTYSAVIQLASYVTPEGKTVEALSPKSAIALLQGGLIDAEVQKYAGANKLDPRALKISAKTPQDSNIVVVTSKGSLAMGTALAAIEKNIAASLEKNTSSLIDGYLSNITAELAQTKNSLAQLNDPDVIAAKKAGLKETWQKKQSYLTALQRDAEVLLDKRKGLGQSIELEKGLAKELQKYLVQARSNALSSAHSTSPTQAMTALLLGNQIQQTQTQLTKTNQRLTVDLPQQLAQVEADIAKNQQDQISQATAVAQAKLAYQNLDAQQKRDVTALQIKIDKLQSQLNSTQTTHLVGEPVRSIEPTGLSRVAIVVLAFVLGVFLALLMAGVAGYVGAVRRAMAPDRSVSKD